MGDEHVVPQRQTVSCPFLPQLVLRLRIGSGTSPTGRRSASDVTFRDSGQDRHDGS